MLIVTSSNMNSINIYSWLFVSWVRATRRPGSPRTACATWPTRPWCCRRRWTTSAPGGQRVLLPSTSSPPPWAPCWTCSMSSMAFSLCKSGRPTSQSPSCSLLFHLIIIERVVMRCCVFGSCSQQDIEHFKAEIEKRQLKESSSEPPPEEGGSLVGQEQGQETSSSSWMTSNGGLKDKPYIRKGTKPFFSIKLW